MAGTWFARNPPVGMADPNPTTIPSGDAGGQEGYRFIYGQNPGWLGPDGQMYDQDSAGNYVPRISTEGVARDLAPPQPGDNGPSTPAATGSPTPPPGGYTEAWFRQNFGSPSTPEQLVALEAKLAAAGIKVRRNASGIAGDIELPGGQVVDVIAGAMQGGTGPNWLPDSIYGGGGGSGVGNNMAAYPGTFTGGGRYPLASVMGTGLMQPWTTPFQAPDDVTQQNDPGWAFRMKEGTKAIERSAAARGTLLTGGAAKDLAAFAQDFASNEYDKVYGRAKGEYDTAYGIFNNNANNQFSRLYNLSSQGLGAAQGTAQNASGYMNSSADNATGAANARASGQAASGAAWGNALGNIGNTVGNTVSAYPYYPSPSSTYYDYYGKPVPLDPNLGGGYG